jgi:hypothetical protein
VRLWERRGTQIGSLGGQFSARTDSCGGEVLGLGRLMSQGDDCVMRVKGSCT